MKRMLFGLMIGICFICPLEARGKKKADPVEQPTQTTPASLLQSIQRELKDPNYRKDILPNNFSYLIQLLEYGSKTNQPRDYTQNVLSLFSKLLKGAEYVNSYVFSSLVEQLPRLLKNNFMFYQPGSPTEQLALNDIDVLDRLQQSVTTFMYGKFTNEFSLFKENPDQFLDDLTRKIVNATSEEMSIEALRQTVVRFMEVGLSKLIWNAQDHEKSWESLKTLSDKIATLMEFNIVDDLNDLDELFWTLIHRYCYFLELHTTELPVSFYERVKQDISTQQLTLFDLEEQETFLQSKSECLIHTLLTQEAQKRAFDLRSTAAQIA